MLIFYIGLFGGFGCLSRYAVSGWTYSLVGRRLPFGTLAVNVIGSFLLGLVMAATLHSTLLPHAVRVGITTGFMGGFTTFSTFSYETFRLIDDGSYLEAGANIFLNLAACLVFASLGIFLGHGI
jgi:CrcB protein